VEYENGNNSSCPRPLGLLQGTIEIPVPLRNFPINSLPISARLLKVLRCANVVVLGDVDGRLPSEFAMHPDCGPKTVNELQAMVHLAMHRGGPALLAGLADRSDSNVFFVPRSVLGNIVQLLAHRNIGQRTIAEIREMITLAVTGEFSNQGFSVPPSVAEIFLVDLPISRRLMGLIRRLGITRLGEFEGRSASELLKHRNIGQGTLNEIRVLIKRARAGEFDDQRIDQLEVPSELVDLIEAGVVRLTEVDRDILLDRVGAGAIAGQVLSLRKVGDLHGVTKARVCQVINHAISALRKMWGPRIPRLLKQVRERCIQKICPLTPQLLRAWVPGFKARTTLSLEAHVRIISKLDKSIPCWPNGHDGVGSLDPHLLKLRGEITRIAEEHEGSLSIRESFVQITRQEQFVGLNVNAFLRTLRQIKKVRVDFNNPETPTILGRQPESAKNGSSQRCRMPGGRANW
jgi:hypothetical protein